MELVYRTYTDDQYSGTRIKEVSYEIVEYYSTNMEKAIFIDIYNRVKSNIMKKRLERKRVMKVKMASAEGAKIKEKKRERKAEKKKQKKKQKILHYELRKS